jgi:hypothetical protein
MKVKNQMTTLKTLLDANVISPGVGVITLLYKDRTTVANLLDDGTIDWGGQVFTSLSTFSLICKRSITHRLTGATTLKTDNGWTSVRYNDELLSDIRSRFLTPDRVIKDVGISQMKGELNDLVDEIEILQLRLKLLELQLESTENAEPPVPETEYGVGIITTYFDGRSSRPLCRDPHNSNKSQYGIICSQHVPECTCPTHRGKTFWRRLTESARVDRNTRMKKDEDYMKSVIGLSSEEYHTFLMSNFRETFSGILPYHVLGKSYAQLRNDLFVIDEIFPRCEGKHLENPNEIAFFLAKVFNYRNTQMILHNNVEARRHGVDVKKYKMLINCTKSGAVYTGAKENFDEIEPSREAVSYMLTFVNDFMRRET